MNFSPRSALRGYITKEEGPRPQAAQDLCLALFALVVEGESLPSRLGLGLGHPRYGSCSAALSGKSSCALHGSGRSSPRTFASTRVRGALSCQARYLSGVDLGALDGKGSLAHSGLCGQFWRVGRAVEGGGLENRRGFVPTGGSNPSPSAKAMERWPSGLRRHPAKVLYWQNQYRRFESCPLRQKARDNPEPFIFWVWGAHLSLLSLTVPMEEG